MSIDTTDADDVGQAPVELDHRPAMTSGIVSLFAGLVAMLASGLFATLALLFGLAGVSFLGIGLFVTESRSWVSLGVTSLFVGILTVGVLGAASTPLLLISMVALLVAWDVGQHAVTVGEQFGRTPPTQRGELVHAAGSGLVGILSAGVVYGVYLFGTGDQPVLAVILLVVGSVVLIWSLRE